MITKTWIVVPFVTLSLMMPAYAALAPNKSQISPNSLSKTDLIVKRLIECESGGQNVVKLDSNNKYSYGVLQIQLDTWNQWAKESGLSGEPMNKVDAVKMAKWAIQNGYIKHWTEWEYAVGLQDKCKWQR